MKLRHLVGLFCALPLSLGAQTYGFVTRLGRDTVAVERIVRTTQEIVGDAIERYPQVVIRHYDAFVNPDGRPLLRGRKILGNPTLVPFDSVWRTGADAATQFTTTASLSLGGVELMPGSYTLWTMPSRNGATLIVNRQRGQWGTEYDPTQDVGRVALKTEAMSAPIEQFTIRIVPINDTSGSLVLEWERFRWTAAITIR